MISRNEPMGTVERTRKNLVYMRNARKAGADIHEVTHLLNSLLALNRRTLGKTSGLRCQQTKAGR